MVSPASRVPLLAALPLLLLAGCPAPSSGGPDGGPDAGLDQCTVDSDCLPGRKCDLSSGLAVCRLPGELEACLPDAGCGPSEAVCAPIPFLVHACVFPCQSSADCADPVTSCQTPPGGGQLLCLPTSCGDGGLWGPCQADAPGDGTCILGGVFGDVCLAGGTATGDGGCGLARSAGGSKSRCAPGTACTFSDGGQLCLPLCATGGDGGPACLAGTACVGFSGGPVAGFASYGYCAQTCNPEASDCPAGTACIDYVQPPVCWP
ncbi:MAG: hypothetical protein ACYDCL_20330 [Myxococcales bacterium]